MIIDDSESVCETYMMALVDRVVNQAVLVAAAILIGMIDDALERRAAAAGSVGHDA